MSSAVASRVGRLGGYATARRYRGNRAFGLRMIGTVAGRRSVASPMHFDILRAQSMLVERWRLRLARAAWQIARNPIMKCGFTARTGCCLLIRGHAQMDPKSLDFSRTHRYKETVR